MSELEERPQRGRPRLGEQKKSPISTRVPPGQHDVLIKWAARGDVSVSQLVRQIIAKEIASRGR